MFCRQCGKEVPDQAQFCTGCGARLMMRDDLVQSGAMAPGPATSGAEAIGAPYGSDMAGQEIVTRNAPIQAYQQSSQQQVYQQPYQQGYAPGQPVPMDNSKSKIAAGLLAILCLGSLGIHKFYLGYSKQGVIMLLVSLLTFGFGAAVMGVIALIEGIIYLTKSDAEFYNTYVVNQKPWF